MIKNDCLSHHATTHHEGDKNLFWQEDDA